MNRTGIQGKAQFSIYKLSAVEVERAVHHSVLPSDPLYIEKATDIIWNEMVKELQENTQTEIISVCDREDFYGIIYRSYHKPSWQGIAADLLTQNEEGAENETSKTESDKINDQSVHRWGAEKETKRTESDKINDQSVQRSGTESTYDKGKYIENVNVSYVFLYIYQDSIYAMTGGYGKQIIRNYIEKNWGLHLLPKLVKRDTGMIRHVKEHRMLGNTVSISRANRHMTNFLLENDMDRIFRELSVEVSRSIGEEMGITREHLEKRNVAVLFTDSVVVRRQVTMEELEYIISKLAEIEKREDRFSLGYFTDVRKNGMKSMELMEVLIQDLLKMNFENLRLIGEDYLEFYRNSSEYELLKDNGECYYNSEIPFSLEDVFEVLEEDPDIHLTKTFLRTFLKKWKIRTLDENGYEKLHPTPVLDCMQGFIHMNGKEIPCYLIQSGWYCLDDHYLPYINKNFQDLYEQFEIECQPLRKKYNLTSDEVTEDAYNQSFMDKKDFLVGHKALVDGYEIADLIFWDEKQVYLMCNKMHFDGNGSRDLTNQILSSARYFQRRVASESRQELLQKYYHSILKKYTAASMKIPIGESEFLELFQKRQLCYIAGYMENYKKNTKSPYARYFVVDLYRKMKESGCDCLVMGIR